MVEVKNDPGKVWEGRITIKADSPLRLGGELPVVLSGERSISSWADAPLREILR